MRFTTSLAAVALALAIALPAMAAVSPQEAHKLGTSLTPVGAEMAASKDGFIPAYTGGLTSAPAGYQKGSGIRPDPYAADKPRLVITSKNMATYAKELTAGAQQLLKSNPSFRIDVYPTHRPVAYPKQILANTLKNATNAKSVNGGLGIQDALPGVPFPIPKTGAEAMWNHLLKYEGADIRAKFDIWNVDASGTPILATAGEGYDTWPIYEVQNLTKPIKGTDPYWRIKITYSAPARRSGEALMLVDAVNPLMQPRRAWQYLPGQRRVKLAPSIAYDTPNPGAAGAATYDDSGIFNGAMDRYDWKLLGKKEMIVPYDANKLVYAKNASTVLKPKFLNPDDVRWELHRVWVVEATLKPGKRHIYAKRVFYLDEDSWAALASDEYDAHNTLYRSSFDNFTFSYDAQAPFAECMVTYDFIAGSYSLSGLVGPYYGVKYIKSLPASEWSPDALAGAGIN